MPTKRVTALNADNVAILNAIRNSSSLAYQQRIPAATQGDIQQTVDNLLEYKPAMNEFVDALVNRIGDVVVKSKIWSNPLSRFKRGMLQYGDTIEELGLDLLEAKRYDPNKCYEDVFKCNPPDVMSNFHTINRQDYYELTINEMLLRRAFLSDYGLQDLVGRVMETPYTSDYWDEYLIMKNLFAEYARVDGFYKVHVPDATTVTTRAERTDVAMTITESVRSMAGRLKFISRDYNAAHLPTSAKPGELVLFATPEFIAMLDVNVIAFAFNVSAADINLSIVEIDDFGIDGCQAILVDEDFFMCADTLISFESIRNPKAMSWNYWLHHWGIYSVSRFVSAVMFTTEAGSSVSAPSLSVASVEVDYAEVDGTKPTFAEKGGKTRFIATVDGTVNPPTPGIGVPQGVVWSITASDKPLSTKTFVDAEGVLHVWADEEATNVTIQAATTYIDPSSPVSGQTAKTATLIVGLGSAYIPPKPTE
jgi:hypothetical protein